MIYSTFYCNETWIMGIISLWIKYSSSHTCVYRSTNCLSLFHANSAQSPLPPPCESNRRWSLQSRREHGKCAAAMDQMEKAAIVLASLELWARPDTSVLLLEEVTVVKWRYTNAGLCVEQPPDWRRSFSDNLNQTVEVQRVRAAAAGWWRQRDGGGDKGGGWKSPRDGSCSPSPESPRGSLMRLCLLDKRLFDNLMHRRGSGASTIYTHSSLLGRRSCHPTHAGIIPVSSVHPSSACVHMWAESWDAGDESGSDIASPHLSNHLLSPSSGPTPQIWYFGCHLALLFPAAPKLPSSFLLPNP